jgi:cell wall-associated NlpC family hydrolase
MIVKSKQQKITKKSIASPEPTNKSRAVSSSIRQDIVAYAKKFEGGPYVWGGTSLTKGADCSGFTQSVFKDKGIKIPRTSRSQAASGKKISINKVKPADLIFYRKNGIINHVAIYIGDGKVISASSKKNGIRITEYDYRDPYKAVSYMKDS